MNFLRSLLSGAATFVFVLVLAVIIWATAVRASDPVEIRILEVGVDTVGIPADASLVSRPPVSVFITVEGSASALDDSILDVYSGLIDLTEVPYGESEVPIVIRGERDQVQVLSQSPEFATIRLEQIVTRDIPVILQVRGEVARGHRLGNVRVEPDTIQVTGPAPRVDQLSESRVTVFVDDAREDTSEQRRPIFYDVEGNVASVVGLNVNPDEVALIIPIEELAGFAEKPVTVETVGEPARGYRLLNLVVEPSTVQVTGAPADIQDLIIQTEPVDITGLSESGTQQVTLALPEGVTLVDVQPVVVTVEIEPILSSDVVVRPVEVRALGEGLEAIVDPEEVRVFLFGPIPVLDTIQEDDVRVTVDLLNLMTGTHVLEPLVTISAAEIQFRSTQPAAVTVLITEALTITDFITDTEVIDSLSFIDDAGQKGSLVSDQLPLVNAGFLPVSLERYFFIKPFYKELLS